MAKNIIVVNCDIRETRVALIEEGIIAELHVERRSNQPIGGSVGDVYLGKVTRVLPGLQAAFIDIGLERAAFLHVEDLIRSDDFESFLAGGRRHALDAGGGDRTLDTSGDESRKLELAIPQDAEDSAVDLGGSVPDAEGGFAAEEDAVVDLQSPAEPDGEEAPHVVDAGAHVPPVAPSDRLSDAAVADPDATLPAPPAEAVAATDAPPAEPRQADGPSETLRIQPEASAAAPAETFVPDEVAADGPPAVDDDSVPAPGPAAMRPPRQRRGHASVRERGTRVEEAAEASVPDVAGAEHASVADVVEASDSLVDLPPAADSVPESDDSVSEVPFLDEEDDGAIAASGADAPLDDSLDDLDDPNLPGFTITDPNEPVPKVVADRGPSGDRRRGRRRRGSRGRDEGGGEVRTERKRDDGRGRSRGTGDASRGVAAPQKDGAPGRERTERGGERKDGGDRQNPNRISRSTPIRDIVKEGQEVIVQVTKEPIGTKGARCSSHVSLAGRYVVYLPTVDHFGVSKRIGSDKERARLREAIEAARPPTGGLIVRTVAEGLTKKSLKQDVGYLVRLWGEIAKRREEVGRAPALLSSELDLVLKAARDLFTDTVSKIVIDDRKQFERLTKFVEMFMPERLADIEYYGDDEPIFDAYGIEDEVGRALQRRVPLPSGGYLIIDQAEALTAIDVNTGKFVGKGSKDLEETILKTNLEAVQEIAYQLRLRNVGGLIILDLIDMDKASSREKVRKRLEEVLQRDKAKTTLNRVSELGLIEMTRKRTRESLGRLLHESCFYCDGKGYLQSRETIAYEILRDVKRRRHDLPGYDVTVNCHPAVADLFAGSEREALKDAESRYMRRIRVRGREEYHIEQFDVVAG